MPLSMFYKVLLVRYGNVMQTLMDYLEYKLGNIENVGQLMMNGGKWKDIL
jgi:hypothetical protein